MKKYLFLIAIISVFFACSDDNLKRVEMNGSVFGTTYKIIYLGDAKNYSKSIDSIFDAINYSVSTYIPTSLISRVNKTDFTVQIDSIFKEVFIKSKVIFGETDGFFDPTVGSLVNAYGFGPKKTKLDLTKNQIDSIMNFVGFDKVSLKNSQIIKSNANVYLDFNSIAKGFGIDLVARFFEDQGVTNYLVEIGGEIRTKGAKEEGKSWVIQVVNPVDADNNGGYTTINLSDKSMATSGNYRKFRIADNGTKYVHTINPKTGLAQESNLLSASVIATSDCADVDAYATAIMAMGLEKAKAFIEKRPDLKVILIYSDANNTLKEYSNLN